MKQKGYNWKRRMSSIDVIYELDHNSWIWEKGTSGTSHRNYVKNNISVTVPYHGKTILAPKTLKSIIERVNLAEL